MTAPVTPPSELDKTAKEKPGIPEVQAKQTVDENWDPLRPPPIDGLYLKEVKNVIYQNGVLTEIFRPEWFEDVDGFDVGHIVYVQLLPGRVTQWHRHREQRDLVFPVRGTIRMGFYDSREDSPTCGKGWVANFNLHRPRFVHIPQGVWHSLKNIGGDEAVYIVVNDVPFHYDKPDDWLLPAGSEAIPVSLD